MQLDSRQDGKIRRVTHTDYRAEYDLRSVYWEFVVLTNMYSVVETSNMFMHPDTPDNDKVTHTLL